MKSTEEPGVNIINKPDWVKKRVYPQNSSEESSLLARAEDVARVCV